MFALPRTPSSPVRRTSDIAGFAFACDTLSGLRQVSSTTFSIAPSLPCFMPRASTSFPVAALVPDDPKILAIFRDYGLPIIVDDRAICAEDTATRNLGLLFMRPNSSLSPSSPRAAVRARSFSARGVLEKFRALALARARPHIWSHEKSLMNLAFFSSVSSAARLQRSTKPGRTRRSRRSGSIGIMRLFLRAPPTASRPCPDRQAGLLLERAAVLDDFDLRRASYSISLPLADRLTSYLASRASARPLAPGRTSARMFPSHVAVQYQDHAGSSATSPHSLRRSEERMSGFDNDLHQRHARRFR